jgi:predicted permease
LAWFRDIDQDLRYAARTLRISPGFAAVAVLTLGLGIGANTAIFSVVNAVVLRPLPYRDPGSLVLVETAPPSPAEPWVTAAWRDRAKTVSDFAGFNGPIAATLVAGGESEQVQSAFITWNFLSLLGVSPAVGRDFTEGDAAPGAPAVALLSHHLWTARFGRESSIVGRTVTVSGTIVTIVGVAPPAFRFPAAGTPLQPATLPDVMRVASPSQRVTVIGRLAPGIPASSAARELLGIYKQAAASLLDDGKPEFSESDVAQLRLQVGLLQERLAGNVRERLWLAMGAVGFVLLIACANVANLLLARGTVRQRELALRAALGASKGRLVRFLLTESLLLAVLGSALGMVIAVSTSGVARVVLAERLSYLDAIAVDWWVLAFTITIAGLTGTLCGLASIPGATRISLAAAFNGDTPAVTRRRTMHHVLLTAEIAVTFVLVVGAALLVQTLWNLSTKDRGFQPDGLLTVRVSPGTPRDLDRTDRRADSRYFAMFFTDLRDRLERLPGVASAGAVSRTPLAGTASRLVNITVEGSRPAGESSTPIAFATPGYFAAMRVPIVAGRDFDARDNLGAERVVIVNEAFRGRFAAGRNIVGARMTAIAEGFTIVGVTADVPDRSLREPPEPLVMAPLAQMPAGNITWTALTFVLRTGASDPLQLAPAVRKEIWATNPNIVISEVATMDARVARTIRTERDSALLFGLFAVAAIVMAAIGVYGVVAYSVAQRTKEIAIRIALGAARRDVIWLMLRQTFVSTVIGTAVGVGSAATGTRVLASMVYGVTPLDPATFAVAVFVLMSLALAAAWVPARRATATNPLVALKGA